MDEIDRALESLRTELENKEKRPTLSFREFLEIVKREPDRTLRNIFQLFHDMVGTYVSKGEDEYPDDPESIGFVKYDCSKIFSEGTDNPFFADRLFANRFVLQSESVGYGSQQNRVHVFEGPHGCGKSTFLNNLLGAFERYTSTKEGQSFEIFWEIGTVDPEGPTPNNIGGIPCPSHDHPILLIPKNYRINFLDRLLPEGTTLSGHDLSQEKEYGWVFKDEVCTICKSLFWALFDKFGSLEKVWEFVRVRPYKFDRCLGEGISVFNPGDKPIKEVGQSDKQIQGKLNRAFGINRVKYVFSPLARTNNGIYVLMDIKSHNKDRLLELHNVVSEGAHRVNSVEERICSLFIALMNPEDKKDIEEVGAKSFEGRIQYNKIPYVLEVPTEVRIYHGIFGDQVGASFLPRVMENFARVIISSRMNTDCKPLREWIPQPEKYKKYCDENGLLLRMEIYGGIIPVWLSEEDRKNFTAKVRKKMIAEAENEGDKGFSGRESIKLFGDFFGRYGAKPNLITMGNVCDFFRQGIDENHRKLIPENFVCSLVDWYDYGVLCEVKESLYFYNRDQVARDILHYLWAVNYDLGSKVRCGFTGEEIEVTIEFLKLIGSYVSGRQMDDQDALKFAAAIQGKYTKTIAQSRAQSREEMMGTELYKELHRSYSNNLKENAFRPFLENASFHEAIKFYGKEGFSTFDTRIREHITHMISTLVETFGYTEKGAQEIGLYAIENKLIQKFS